MTSRLYLRGGPDGDRAGKRGCLHLAPTPGVGLSQAVQDYRRDRVVHIEVHRVREEAVDGHDSLQ